MDEGRTINLSELLRYILLKWRGILVWMIIFAVLMSGMSVYTSYKKFSNENMMQSEIDYSVYEKDLSDREIQEVKNAVEDYETNMETYNDYKRYKEKSIKMQIDSNAVPTKKVIYRISGNKEVMNISNAFIEMIPNETINTKILQNINIDTEESYIGELISINNIQIDNLLEKTENSLMDINDNSSNNDSSLIAINIIADKKNNCQLIGEIVDEEMDDIISSLEKVFGTFSLQKVSESYYEEANQELLKEQQSCNNDMNSVRSIIKGIKDSLSEGQQAYYLALINGESNNINGSESVINNGEKINVNTLLQWINKKYIIVGLLLGACIYCFILICRFPFIEKLKSKLYLTNELKCPVIGFVYKKKEKRRIGEKIDKCIEDIFDPNKKKISYNDQLEMLYINIRVALEKSQVKKLYITSSTESEEINKISKGLKDYLNEDNVSIILRKSFLYNAESLEEFVNSDAVIFIEQIDKSINREIYEQLQYCEKYQINNLGCIVVQ